MCFILRLDEIRNIFLRSISRTCLVWLATVVTKSSQPTPNNRAFLCCATPLNILPSRSKAVDLGMLSAAQSFTHNLNPSENWCFWEHWFGSHPWKGPIWQGAPYHTWTTVVRCNQCQSRTFVYLPTFYVFKAGVFSNSLDPSAWVSNGIGYSDWKSTERRKKKNGFTAVSFIFLAKIMGVF